MTTLIQPCTFRALETRVILVRSAVTDWHEQGKLLGQCDRDLSSVGLEQAERIAAVLEGCRVSDLVCSPLQRAVQTAQAIGRRCGLDTARDQRLTALSLGDWEGRDEHTLLEEPLYQQFRARPTDVRLPGGEGIESARRRAVGAVQQALGDAAPGDVIALVTHSSIIRMLLGHFIGAPVGTYLNLRVDPGSLSVLSFADDGDACLQTLNWQGDLATILATS